ncbi:MAG: bacillithiol biosynthesis deacetylase BshB1 [Actinomycetota bacterium]|jgi:bacillithiol biosynthesis deacetylase BshB1|nr:bacillithiol biosynthesis deacetylase BshB1 [Actinomycetota bacterium]
MIDALCIGAHPDDVEIGMGATVAGMVARGLEVAIVDLTDGEPTPHGTKEIRAAEAGAAASALGVAERRTLTQPNRYLFDTVEARTELAEVIRELQPRVLYVPYPEDAHPDHIAASQIAMAARFYSKFTKTDMAGEPHYPAKIYHYGAVHMRVVAKPDFVVDVSAHLDVKIAALLEYASQFSDNPRNAGVIPSVTTAAHMWGGMIGVEAGEPFFSPEPIGIVAPETLV